MHESSESEIIKTNTGIQSGADTFDQSRLVITFLANLGAMGTLRILN